ncbi:MAG TPA: acyltransferase family protein [Sphingopyxis sp.]|nr:acyltransferase family protein [Sphingopyxis sp.]
MTQKAMRQDIQGMRALAVLSVVLFHYFPEALPGGFTGVDIFFVISGYLITKSIVPDMGLPLGEMTKRFYRRRIRRIFPALFVMILVTMAVGYAVMFPDAYERLGLSAASSVLFVSNFYFWSTGGYFAAPAATEPLLHTWSLSIEEQFYIVFPIAIFCLYRYAGKHVAAIVAAATLALFALSEYVALYRPSAGYYFTGSRAYELAIGATLALAPKWEHVPARAAEVMAGAGLAGVVAGFVVLDESSHFPGTGALFPCLGAAALLLAGANRLTMVGRAISNRVFRYIGDISYSFYLWHWPPLAFLKYYYGLDLDPGLLLACLLVSFGLSAASYHFVEQRFMPRRGLNLPYLKLGAAMVATGSAACLFIAMSKGLPQRFTPDALAALATARDYSPERARCHYDNQARFDYADTCVFGAPGVPARIAVWGDSHGAELAYALGERARAEGSAVRQITGSGCPPAVGYARRGRAPCREYNERMLAGLAADDTIHVVVIASYLQNQNYDDKAALLDGMERAVAQLRAAGKRVIVTMPIPVFDFDPPEALARSIQRGGGGGEFPAIPSQPFFAETAQYRAYLNRLAVKHGAALFDPAKLICDARLCHLQRPGIGATYFNASHISLSTARAVSDRMWPMIEAGHTPSAAPADRSD